VGRRSGGGGARSGRVPRRGLRRGSAAGLVGAQAAAHNEFIEQRRAGVVVGSSEERYRDLVENSNELIWSADAFGRWTFVNAAARRIYGSAPEEMIGRPMTDWMVPGDAARDLRALERILE
jgi:PAS domain-containing protein